MLNLDSAQRITIEALHEHTWFAEPTPELAPEAIAASMQRFYDGADGGDVRRGGVQMQGSQNDVGRQSSVGFGGMSGRNSKAGKSSRHGACKLVWGCEWGRRLQVHGLVWMRFSRPGSAQGVQNV